MNYKTLTILLIVISSIDMEMEGNNTNNNLESQPLDTKADYEDSLIDHSHDYADPLIAFSDSELQFLEESLVDVYELENESQQTECGQILKLCFKYLSLDKQCSKL